MASEDELFDLFGRTSFRAQMFELTIGTLVITMKTLSVGKFADDEEDHRKLAQDFIDHVDRKTLGQIIENLKQLIPGMDDQISDTLARALDARNRLVHGFFAKYMDECQTPQGRDLVIGNLRSKLDAINVADDLANERIDYLRRQMQKIGLIKASEK